MKSSSWHQISADQGLRFYRRPLYRFLNLLNRQRPLQNVDPALRRFAFQTPHEALLRASRELPALRSPSRTLSDLFWWSFPWEKAKEALRGLHIFDTGCGNGAYASLFQKWSGERLDTYRGLDISERAAWKDLVNQGPFSFASFDGKNIEEHIPAHANFFTTQSALEHFEKDIEYFESMAKFLLKKKAPAIQVHLFPSGPCVRTFPFHGVRQYTPRTISRLIKPLRDFSQCSLFELGGQHCVEFHVKKILKRKGGDLRAQNPGIYQAELWRAIEDDMADPTSHPAFYALLIESFTEGAEGFVSKDIHARPLKNL